MSFVNAMDNFTPKSIGENAHVQYSWSNNLNEKIVQFYFQLVRNADHNELKKQLNDMLFYFKGLHKKGQTVPTYIDSLSLLYKLIAHTRDIIDGKGEYSLTYMQILVWYEHFPKLAQIALDNCLSLKSDIDSGTQIHPYGSWKDIKYFCEYVKKNTNDENHNLIHYAVRKLVYQLRSDITSFTDNKPISLASKWCPREKGRFAWLYKYIVFEMFSVFFTTCENGSDRWISAYKKGARELRKILSMLNNYIDTTQIKMCNKSWSDIDFNKVTSITMRKQNLSFLNLTKNGLKKSKETDRITCANNLKKHIDDIKNGNSNKKINGKRVNLYEFVSDALKIKNSINNKDSIKLLNEQWKDNLKLNKGLTNFIAMADTSGSMSCDNCIPLYNSIGLAIRISEVTNKAFRDRILTFSANPSWINLSGIDEFTDKVYRVANADWGMNTNFYKAMKMILDSILESELSPFEVEHMALVILSDMQMDVASKEDMNTLYDNIEEMYRLAGLQSKFKIPFHPPHIIFWNLSASNGFPVLSNQKNVTMISGYNASLLNSFCQYGLDALKNYTPMKMLENMLNNKRYKIMDAELYDYFDSL